MIFKNFLNIKNSKIIKKDFLRLLKAQPLLFETLKPTYKYSYSKKIVKKYKRLSNIRIIGMGGSVLGSEAIYDFLKPKIKKKITFVNNLNSNAEYFDNKNNIQIFILGRPVVEVFEWMKFDGFEENYISKILIKKYQKLDRNKIDVAYLGAWNFKEEIFRKEKVFIKKSFSEELEFNQKSKIKSSEISDERIT